LNDEFDVMNVSVLSNYQLYELLNNDGLNKSLKKNLKEEFQQRKISGEAFENIIQKHKNKFPHKNDEPLSIILKLVLIAVPVIIFPPFIAMIYSIVASVYLPNGMKRKWKEYWQSIMLGTFLWTVVTILVAMYIN
jgi:ABC-type Fe3+ transport system permease subunit